MKEEIKANSGTDWFVKVMHGLLLLFVITLWSMLWYDMGYMIGSMAVVVR